MKAFEDHCNSFEAVDRPLKPISSYNSDRGFFAKPAAVCTTGDRRLVVLDAGTGLLCFFTATLSPLRPTTSLVRVCVCCFPLNGLR